MQNKIKNISELIGIPWTDLGRDKNGLDCFGLVLKVYEKFGISIPDVCVSTYACKQVDKEINKAKKIWIKVDTPTAPCVLAIKENGPLIRHLGVYIGNGKFIHSRIQTGVTIERISSPLWKMKIKGYYKYEQ